MAPAVQVFLRASCHHTPITTSKSPVCTDFKSGPGLFSASDNLVLVKLTDEYGLPRPEYTMPLVSNIIHNFLTAGNNYFHTVTHYKDIINCKSQLLGKTTLGKANR